MLFLAIGIFSTASADEAKEVSGRHIGVTSKQSLSHTIKVIVRPGGDGGAQSDWNTGREKIKEAAGLLFHHFRLMTSEAAAFEFYMDCLDIDE
ncbi:MAG: hypothetical protein H7240_03135 [Glaciimonas sp.]|nr:hypothetical protein [Glaciimonas sp.]